MFWPQKFCEPHDFSYNLNLELSGGLKVRCSEINLLYKSCSNHKILFSITVLKVWVTNLQGFFDQRNFYLIKLISEPLTLRPPLSSRLRSYEKSWGSLNFWGQNLLISVVQMTTFLKLTTPVVYKCGIKFLEKFREKKTDARRPLLYHTYCYCLRATKAVTRREELVTVVAC